MSATETCRSSSFRILDIQMNGPAIGVPVDDGFGLFHRLVGQDHLDVAFFEQVTDRGPGHQAGTQYQYLFHVRMGPLQLFLQGFIQMSLVQGVDGGKQVGLRRLSSHARIPRRSAPLRSAFLRFV
jgi:hypothetical protein